MGQGLHTKIAQVVAETLRIDIAQVKVMATATDKVPNASSTAASSGSDLNGMAAANAAEQIRDRLIEFVLRKYGCERQAVRFEANAILVGDLRIGWPELAEQAYLARIPLSAAGYYSTPGIHWNRDAGRGHPYLYYAYGASCSEVTVDTLTGEYSVDRVDILHDVGRSLNPAIDIGQIEGGFVQGMGWLTTEELWWDGKGRLRTHAPSTYKIPVASDIPKVFNVKLADWSENRAATIGRSKAVGEPPFMLALSVFEALGMAAASVADYRIAPRMDAPATPERVLMTIERLKRQAGATPAAP
jgi:xanthine dehydrogenase large subunit